MCGVDNRANVMWKMHVRAKAICTDREVGVVDLECAKISVTEHGSDLSWFLGSSVYVVNTEMSQNRVNEKSPLDTFRVTSHTAGPPWWFRAWCCCSTFEPRANVPGRLIPLLLESHEALSSSCDWGPLFSSHELSEEALMAASFTRTIILSPSGVLQRYRQRCWTRRICRIVEYHLRNSSVTCSCMKSVMVLSLHRTGQPARIIQPSIPALSCPWFFWCVLSLLPRTRPVCDVFSTWFRVIFQLTFHQCKSIMRKKNWTLHSSSAPSFQSTTLSCRAPDRPDSTLEGVDLSFQRHRVQMLWTCQSQGKCPRRDIWVKWLCAGLSGSTQVSHQGLKGQGTTSCSGRSLCDGVYVVGCDFVSTYVGCSWSSLMVLQYCMKILMIKCMTACAKDTTKRWVSHQTIGETLILS